MTLRSRMRTTAWAGVLGAIALAAMLGAAQVRAATTYPAGGSSFTGSAEGWKVSQAAQCTFPLPLLCSATAGHDGGAGNPAGSLALNSNALINVAGLLAASAAFESPDFVATEGGAGTLRIERALSSSNVVDLTPKLDFEARLIDRTSGTSSPVFAGSASGSNVPFAGAGGAVNLVKGHVYAISIAASTSSELVSLGLLGSTAARFDNVALTVGSSGGGDGGGAGGAGGQGGAGGKGGAGAGAAGGLTRLQLTRIVRSNTAAAARMKGNRIFIRSKCPRRIGVACRIVMQGHLNKRKAATNRRRVRLGKGKSRRVALTVKRFARGKVKRRRAVLVKQTVRAGGAKVTVFKRLRLVRR